jgi:hypothetical protein
LDLDHGGLSAQYLPLYFGAGLISALASSDASPSAPSRRALRAAAERVKRQQRVEKQLAEFFAASPKLAKRLVCSESPGTPDHAPR